MQNTNSTIKERSPVVVIMGHVDHGKSTLLDYIRETNIVDGEAGGITQHLSAYEVIHKNAEGLDKKINFLDTPGHEAFSGMRDRGAKVADIAILIVSAEDSVKTQTLEAIKTIKENNIPYIVGINKIDKNGANIEKTKNELIENEVYLEGMGGNIPFVLISAKTGQGIPDLLETILLVAELEQYTGDISLPASGVIIESKQDPKRGSQATLIIKNGSLSRGQYVVAGGAWAPTRMLENFLGENIDVSSFSSPIRIAGFSIVPSVGTSFLTVNTKKEAEELSKENMENNNVCDIFDSSIKCIPLIIKTDVAGTGEAILKEVRKLDQETIAYKIIHRGVGTIGENDIKLAMTNKDTVVIGFNVKMDATARDINEKIGAKVEIFDIIYKLTDTLKILMEEKRPRVETLESLGKIKIIKTFSQSKNKVVVGGKVIEGKITNDSVVRIIRRENEIGRGRITELQKSKSKTREAIEGEECGMEVETKIEIAGGDVLESFVMTHK